MTRFHPVLAGSALLLLVSLTACGEGQKPPPAPPPPVVTIAKPTVQTVVDKDEYVGRFVAVDSVQINARVSGYLESIHFKDGQLVKQGDLLFSIDKRPFQNTLDQARANLQQAQSSLALAEADLARGQQLVKDRTITEQTFDQRTQASRSAQAAGLAQQAMVRQAELDLQFTELRAPVSGRIGDRRVSPGNLVAGGAGTPTMLATIVSIDPIRFEFTFDEASYLKYERLAKSVTDQKNGNNIEVALKLIDEKEFVHKGRMDFIDNVIERSSGTIRGRAQFANPDALFTTGMFGRIEIPASAPYEAVLVPDAALGSEQSRRYVYTIGAENKPVQKFVVPGQLIGGNLRVVREGLGKDDTFITNGLARIRPGQPVNPQAEGVKPPDGGAKPPGQAEKPAEPGKSGNAAAKAD